MPQFSLESWLSCQECLRFRWTHASGTLRMSWREHVSEHRWRIGLLTAMNRRRYLTLTMRYKVAKLRTPAALVDTLPLTPGTTFRRGRSASSDRFVIPAVRHGSYVRSFAFSSIREWNMLPASIKASDGIASFKRALMAHLLISKD